MGMVRLKYPRGYGHLRSCIKCAMTASDGSSALYSLPAITNQEAYLITADDFD